MRLRFTVFVWAGGDVRRQSDAVKSGPVYYRNEADCWGLVGSLAVEPNRRIGKSERKKTL